MPADPRDVHAMPCPPAGYEALRSGSDGTFTLFGPHDRVQVTHLIRAGRPSMGTLCGLTLFAVEGREADVPGWSRGGGVSGPGIRQTRCGACWVTADEIE